MNEFLRNIALIFAATLIATLVSCDRCDGEGGGSKGETVLFASKPAGARYPSVFSASPNGLDFKEIARNAIVSSPGSNGGKIVFIGNYDGNRTVYAGLASSGDYNKIATEGGPVSRIERAAISPDGNFAAFDGGSGQLFLVRADGTQAARRSVNLADKTNFGFSRAGDYFAFIEGDANADFTVKVIDRSADVEIASFQYSNETPPLEEATIYWTSDDRLIFCEKSALADDIIIKSLDGAADEIFTVENIGANNPAISKDGSKIAFTSDNGDIWTLETTSEAKAIFVEAAAGERCLYPVWSPDATRILFVSVYETDFISSRCAKISDGANGGLIICSNAQTKAFWK